MRSGLVYGSGQVPTGPWAHGKDAMTKRWIMNAAERSVREQIDLGNGISEDLNPGEFYWTGTYADAMAAGARRRLAEEALNALDSRYAPGSFVLVSDRIEPKCGCTRDVH